MKHTLLKTWWVPILRGLAAIIFGALGILFPNGLVIGTIAVFGVYAITDGGIRSTHALVTFKDHPHGWLALAEALISKVIGVLVLLRVILNSSHSYQLVAVWGILTGMLQFAASYHLSQLFEDGIPLAIIATLSIGIGGLLLWQPLDSAFAPSYAIGIVAVIYGGVFIVHGFSLRSTFGSWYPFA